MSTMSMGAALRHPGPVSERPEGSDFPDLPLVLPDLPWQPSAMQVFMFSAATWNRHRIHYERDAARAEGHADVVVQRALIGNVFARHALGWLDGGARLQRLGWRVLASALPGQLLRCQGAVTGRIAHPVASPGNPHAAHPGTLPLQPDGPGTWLHYEARLTRVSDGVDIALAEGTLCIPATR